MIQRLLSFVAVIAVGPHAGAEILHDGPFQVHYAAPMGAPEARDVAQRLRAAAARVEQALGPPPAPALSVVLHPSAEAFARATGQPRRAGAALWRGELHVQARALAARGELDRTLTHELAHLAVRALAAGRCPRWLEEGTALVVAGELSGLAPAAPMPPAEASRRIAAGVDEEAYRAAGAYASRLALGPGGLGAVLAGLASGALAAGELVPLAQIPPVAERAIRCAALCCSSITCPPACAVVAPRAACASPARLGPGSGRVVLKHRVTKERP